MYDKLIYAYICYMTIYATWQKVQCLNGNVKKKKSKNATMSSARQNGITTATKLHRVLGFAGVRGTRMS